MRSAVRDLRVYSGLCVNGPLKGQIRQMYMPQFAAAVASFAPATLHESVRDDPLVIQQVMYQHRYVSIAVSENPRVIPIWVVAPNPPADIVRDSILDAALQTLVDATKP